MRVCFVESTLHDCLFVRATGPIDIGHMTRSQTLLVDRAIVRSGAPMIADMRAVEFQSSFKPPSIAGLAELPLNPGAVRKLAFIASDDLSFGILRMLASHRGTRHQTNAVFRAFGEAFAWAGRPDLGATLPADVEGSLGTPVDGASTDYGAIYITL